MEKDNIESKPGLGFSTYTDGGQKNPGSSNRMTRASPTGRWWHNPATGGFYGNQRSLIRTFAAERCPTVRKVIRR